MWPMWIFVAFWLVIGLAHVVAPERVALLLYGRRQPTRNPFDTRWSSKINRIVGIGFITIAGLIGYGLWYAR